MSEPTEEPDPETAATLRDHDGGASSSDQSVHLIQGDAWSAFIDRLRSRGDIWRRYHPKGKVAEGGMGVIQKVFDEDTQRVLAMKVVRNFGEPGSGAGSGQSVSIGRFLEEAQVTAQLEHPGIVPVHEVGLDQEGQLYFTMKLVQGADLREILRYVAVGHEGWNQTRAVSVILRVCEAMSYAHAKNVIHRDLKPPNIMVGRFGETYVMDWGIAKVLGFDDADRRFSERGDDSRIRSTRFTGESTPAMTEHGDVVGTPAYMSPEQAGGDPTTIDARSDVYSVGAILYQLLAGRIPYTTPDEPISPYELLEKVRTGPPTPVARVGPPDLPAELIAICERAMERDPGDRYPTMSELAEDLRAYLENRVVKAYATGPIQELKKWVSRNRTLATTALVAMLAVVTLAVWATIERGKAKEQAALARASEQEAREEVEKYAEVDEFVRDLFLRLSPEVAQGKDRTLLLSMLDDATERLEKKPPDVPLVEAAIRRTLGEACYGLATYEAAERHLAAAIHIYQSEGAEDDTGLFDAMNTLGVIYMLDRRFDEAEPLLKGSLAGRLATLGSGNDDTLTSQTNVATLEKQRGNLEEAERLLSELYESNRDIHGETNDHTLTVMNNLAQIYSETGRNEAAEPLFRKALEIQELKLSPTHPQTLKAMNNLAMNLEKLGKSQEAILILARSFELKQTIYEETHPSLLVARNNLASLYRSAGDHQSAISLLEEGLEKAAPARGPQDLHIAVMRWTLAPSYRAQDRREEEEEQYRLARPPLTAAFGPHSSQAQSCGIALGRLLLDLERIDEAAEVATEITDAARASDKTQDSVLAMSLTLLGEVQLAQNDAGVALATGLEAHELLIGSTAKDNKARAIRLVAEAHRAAGRESDAVEWEAKIEGDE